MKSKTYFKARVKSFRNAFRGIGIIIRTETHAIIHLVASIFAITASILLQISEIEWLFILLAISLVWISEIINTSLERLMNHLHPEHHASIRDSKDLAAGAVLLAAIFALITGLIIFGPAIYNLIIS